MGSQAQPLAASSTVPRGPNLSSISVTFSTTAPAHPKTGDLWYNASDGYQLNQWNGSAWVPYQYGTAAISAGSITAGLLAAGIIYAGIIDGTTVNAATFTGSVFDGSNFIMNAAGAFFYNGTPAAGNLIASTAAAAGNDAFSNRYQGGVTGYVEDGGVWYAINLNNYATGAPVTTFSSAPAFSGPYTVQATIGPDGSGSIAIDATTVNLGANAPGTGGPGVNINPINSINGNAVTSASWSLLAQLGQMSNIANTGTGFAPSGIGTISGTPTAAEYNALNTAYNNAVAGLNQACNKINALLGELQTSNYMV